MTLVIGFSISTGIIMEKCHTLMSYNPRPNVTMCCPLYSPGREPVSTITKQKISVSFLCMWWMVNFLPVPGESNLDVINRRFLMTRNWKCFKSFYSTTNLTVLHLIWSSIWKIFCGLKFFQDNFGSYVKAVMAIESRITVSTTNVISNSLKTKSALVQTDFIFWFSTSEAKIFGHK